ncbi:glycosyltransferase family 2 protein [Candidatus Micrarchaeota archaeon]|nr:glycosyltransferase family 2 protein [Candidatus Micrarchaeota archaeon]
MRINSFSIVVPTYNKKEKLARFLSAVMCQDYPKDKFEVIISDDGSTDGTSQVAKAAAINFKHFTYLKNKHQGTIKSLNAGMKKAKNDFVIDMGDDQMPDPNFLNECNHWINKNPEYSAFTAYQIPTEEQARDNLFASYEYNMVRYYLAHKGLGDPPIISKKALQDIAYLDGAAGYAEDTVMFDRLRNKNYEVMQIPVKVAHMQDYSLRGFIKTARYRGKAGRFLRGRPYFLVKLAASPLMFFVYLYRLRAVNMALMHTAFNAVLSIYAITGVD